MAEPQYHLEGIVRSRNEEMTDFQGPLDVIFLLLSKKIITGVENGLGGMWAQARAPTTSSRARSSR